MRPAFDSLHYERQSNCAASQMRTLRRLFGLIQTKKHTIALLLVWRDPSEHRYPVQVSNWELEAVFPHFLLHPWPSPGSSNFQWKESHTPAAEKLGHLEFKRHLEL